MSFEPEFMRQSQAFISARESVRSIDEWIAFCRCWFDTAQWPIRSATQIASDSMRKRGPVQIDGRTWGYTSSIYDLSAAARYEYTKTYSTVGDPLRFSVPPLEQRSAANGWAQECPYCELITYDLIIDDQAKSACPMCRRELLWTHNAD